VWLKKGFMVIPTNIQNAIEKPVHHLTHMGLSNNTSLSGNFKLSVESLSSIDDKNNKTMAFHMEARFPAIWARPTLTNGRERRVFELLVLDEAFSCYNRFSTWITDRRTEEKNREPIDSVQRSVEFDLEGIVNSPSYRTNEKVWKGEMHKIKYRGSNLYPPEPQTTFIPRKPKGRILRDNGLLWEKREKRGFEAARKNVGT
jgi:hypothetical protein